MIRMLALPTVILTVVVASAAFADAESAFADEYVRGYTRSDGTYVQPHYRSSPDGNPFNNYSTRGNVNPYTGMPGTHNPYPGNSFGSSPSFGNPSMSQPYNPYGLR